MIIMNLKMDNLYGFKDFEINFSYPKKIVNSTIPFEYLKEKPNFRFKRINIIMGANASGKTILGKAMMRILNILRYGKLDLIFKEIHDKTKPAFFEIDLVLGGTDLYRIYYKVLNNDVVKLEIKKSSIRKDDNYERCADRLAILDSTDTSNFECDDSNSEEKDSKINSYQKAENILKNFDCNVGWMFSFPNEELPENVDFDLKILSTILKTFDTSIDKVVKSKEVENAYVIVFKDKQKLILQNGKVVDKSILSSGTQEGISIANILSRMKQMPKRPFYIDEKFSHAQTDIEAGVLNLMIDLISDQSQLFFTTHNTDILELNFPKHSFVFLNKNKNKNIEVVYPSKFIAKNDRSLVNLVKNDILNTLPNTDALYDLLD